MNLLGYLFAFVLALAPTAASPRAGQELIGQPASPWTELQWLDSPLKLSALRGKVVLVRWWSDACPMCSSALPSLAHLDDEYRASGLVVVGVYHPKPARAIAAADRAEIRKAATALGAHFPIAIDANWAVLRRWWLRTGTREFTSASFLIDRRGTIRWVHRGGELHPDTDHTKVHDRDYQELVQNLTELLRELQ